MGDLIITVKDPDLKIFSASELHFMGYVKKYFEKLTAGKITEFSH